MEAIPSLIVVGLVLLFFVLLGKAFSVSLSNEENALPAPKPPKPKPPAPAPAPAPDYLPRWSQRRRVESNIEHSRWEREFADLQLARRAGGLQGVARPRR